MNITVIGLGKLGAPLATLLAASGHQVRGIDTNAETVRKVNDGIAPVEETGLQDLMDSTHWAATSDYSVGMRDSQLTFVVCPTPSLTDGSLSNEYVEDIIRHIGAQLRNQNSYHVVVICSTVMPGTTKKMLELLCQTAERRNLGICYSPEFIALGSVIHDMQYPDLVLIGQSEQVAGNILLAAVLPMLENAPEIRRMSLIDAEIAKISVNAFVTMKLSFANTLAEVCEGYPGAKALEVADAIGHDSRIGGKYLQPATAFAGPCFPRDSRAFRMAADNVNVLANLAVATDLINQRQVERLGEKVLQNQGSIGILGLAYKPNTPVTDESPGLALAHWLFKRGRDVDVYDPMVEFPTIMEHGHEGCILGCSSVKEIEQCDIICIMTPCPEFEYLHTDALIYDCWNTPQFGKVIRVGDG